MSVFGYNWMTQLVNRGERHCMWLWVQAENLCLMLKGATSPIIHLGGRHGNQRAETYPDWNGGGIRQLLGLGSAVMEWNGEGRWECGDDPGNRA